MFPILEVIVGVYWVYVRAKVKVYLSITSFILRAISTGLQLSNIVPLFMDVDSERIFILTISEISLTYLASNFLSFPLS